MNSEYVRLFDEEVTYGEKSLLKSQISLINLIKKYKSFELLRKEEFLLKIFLKSKIDELNNSIALFERMLPKVNVQEEEDRLIFPEIKKDKERTDLESELDLIKAKLASLQ